MAFSRQAIHLSPITSLSAWSYFPGKKGEIFNLEPLPLCGYADLAEERPSVFNREPEGSFKREPMLVESPRLEVQRARGEVFLNAVQERRSSLRFRVNFCHQRCAQRLRSPQVGELCALAGNNIASRRATMNPYWAIAIHPKTAFAAQNTARVNGATLEVSLVQNEAFYGLRHPFSVRVLVHRAKSYLQVIDY
jgi:hypothetical protein